MKISDPTIEMTFAVNDSPFAGKEGKFVTSRNLRDRLEKELLKDVSLHVTEASTDSFNVAGRGEMHLSILMETMRREGYEFAVSTPRVLTKEIDGKLNEVNAVLGAQAVQNQATKDSFQLLQERLECECKARSCADNAIVNYANATFYPKMVADVTTGTTTTAQSVYNPIPGCNNCCK